MLVQIFQAFNQVKLPSQNHVLSDILLILIFNVRFQIFLLLANSSYSFIIIRFSLSYLNSFLNLLYYRMNNNKEKDYKEQIELNMKQKATQTLGIALIICKNPKTGKYLAVNQKDGSWWVPGGRVDAPQFFSEGARRECVQQAGINVDIKGILRFQLSPSTEMVRNKIIFYAEPKDSEQKPKSFADKQSLGAKYMNLEQILSVKSDWRGPELYQWANYLQKGGRIHPLSLLNQTMQE